MNFFRQYLTPLLTILIFLVALVAVSARIFLPSDLAAPAPVTPEELNSFVPELINYTFS
ncbi:hypothetical protein Sta7437_0353 [Stanieria cyanosphaera PCC 7437]|uniref:Uncharacterized protein n=1 Tax=Stanieria cyanosphaera (strain ATCC 29371 / PCC 7437) TaxID=111780 RepID=K9XMY7_STAC7|nr:hypothetical protein [Stanieria cyanosphaera]AFZ33965.1 hypothetical protein Sta7437_0353 [Stanieria cyanosphaera PCC 7437]